MSAVIQPGLPAIPPGFQAPPVIAVEQALRQRIAALEEALFRWEPGEKEPGHFRFSTVLDRFPVVVDGEWFGPDGDRPPFIEIARVWVNGEDIGGDLSRDQIDKLAQYADRHFLDELNEQRILEKTT